MTLDRWIALGACIAACVSAIAAFFVVVQSSLQRKLAYKPQLILKPLSFKYQFNTEKTDVLNQIIFIDADNSTPHKTNALINIGLGTAIDVSLTWSYDLKRVVDLLNEAFKKEGKNKKLTIYQNAISLDVPTNGDDRYKYSREHHNDIIDYILSYNQNQNPISIIVPHTYFSLNCALLFYSLEFLSRMEKSTSTIALHVEYYDIGGVRYNQEYEVKTAYHHSGSINEHTTMYGQLTFTKKRQKLAAAGRARLRESYVNFINEHDFNKNK